MRSVGQIWSQNFDRAFSPEGVGFDQLKTVSQSNRKMLLLLTSMWQIKLLLLGQIDNMWRFPMGPQMVHPVEFSGFFFR